MVRVGLSQLGTDAFDELVGFKRSVSFLQIKNNRPTKIKITLTQRLNTNLKNLFRIYSIINIFTFNYKSNNDYCFLIRQC